MMNEPDSGSRKFKIIFFKKMKKKKKTYLFKVSEFLKIGATLINLPLLKNRFNRSLFPFVTFVTILIKKKFKIWYCYKHKKTTKLLISYRPLKQLSWLIVIIINLSCEKTQKLSHQKNSVILLLVIWYLFSFLFFILLLKKIIRN